MSALPPKTDTLTGGIDVRYVLKAEVRLGATHKAHRRQEHGCGLPPSYSWVSCRTSGYQRDDEPFAAHLCDGISRIA